MRRHGGWGDLDTELVWEGRAMRQLRQLQYIICSLCVVFALTTLATAETFPSRTVRIVVPYVPGGGVSVLAQSFRGIKQHAQRFARSYLLTHGG
jgi:hypothetical protein